MARRGCPPEFRRRVVELVEGGRKVADVAAELGISEQTIYTWRRQARIDAGLEAGAWGFNWRQRGFEAGGGCAPRELVPAPLAASRPKQTSEEAVRQDLGSSFTSANNGRCGRQSPFFANWMSVVGPSSSPDCAPKASEGWQAFAPQAAARS